MKAQTNRNIAGVFSIILMMTCIVIIYFVPLSFFLVAPIMGLIVGMIVGAGDMTDEDWER